jgi:hypothetical protein
MLHLSRTSLTSPSRRHHLRAVVPKAVILVEPTRSPEADCIISRNLETRAIIRRLVGARVKRKVTSWRRLQNLNGSTGSLQVC